MHKELVERAVSSRDQKVAAKSEGEEGLNGGFKVGRVSE